MSADLDDAADAPRVVPVRGFSGRLLPGPHPAEAGERAAIAAAWAKALAEKPKMFDGRVLLGETAQVRDGVLEVAFREVGFSFMIWRREFPPERRPLLNAFGAAAVVSSDGAVLLGRMGDHTANAGRVYFPCGTPDLGDVVGDMVDVDGSIDRELAEETGLGPAEALAGPRRLAVFHGPMAAYVRVYSSPLDGDALHRSVSAHLAAEREPELLAAILKRRGDPLGPEIPTYARAAIGALFAGD